ncbi:MAG: thioesterase family protein [Bacteroidales bacterium]|nr:thioesterase family protein [Bacteroidales bacterium]MBQ9312648.1 thioesterase family protein [Bacteroidales bacterium]
MEELNIPKSTVKEIEYIVKPNDTAVEFRSGEVNVLATPKLIALMEEASYLCVKEFLPMGYVSVGTMIKVEHLKASCVGEKIRIESKFIENDGRKLLFNMQAFSSNELIAKGECERFVVEKQRFEKKALENATK